MNSSTKTVTASGHLAVNQAWLDRHVEAPLDPQYPIIDPHHHLWDAPKPRYLLDEVLADFQAGHNVVSSVFVECRAMYRATGDEALKSLGETRFVDGIAAMSESGAYGATRVCEGSVGYVDLRLGDKVKGILEKHMAISDGRLRGIRNITDLASETQLAITNRQVADIETVFIVTGEAYAFTSSSLIRQIAALGGPLERLGSIVPEIVIERMRQMRDDPNNPLGKLAQDQLVE